MITKLSTRQAGFENKLSALLAWESVSNKEVASTVDDIISSIRTDGDKALVNYSIKFDSVQASSMADLTLTQSQLKNAFNTLNASEKEALGTAAERVKSYHQKQLQKTWTYTENDGTMLGQKITPLDRVGLYVPGGKAAYPSSVLMNAIPAKVAGVEELIMVVPTPGGQVNQLVLAAAYISEVDQVFTVGGAQACAPPTVNTWSTSEI